MNTFCILLRSTCSIITLWDVCAECSSACDLFIFTTLLNACTVRWCSVLELPVLLI